MQLAAISALAGMGPDARPAIPALKSFPDEDPRVRAAALQAVTQIEAAGVLESIRNLFNPQAE